MNRIGQRLSALIGQLDPAAPILSHSQAQTWAVARALYETADRLGHRLDLLQVEKLVYIAHGWSLACRGTPLIDEIVMAETFGPRLTSLGPLRRRYGRETLPSDAGDRIFAYAGPREPIAPAAAEIIVRTALHYAPYAAWQLSALMRPEGGAHARALADGRPYIDNAEIRADFVAIASAQPAPQQTCH